MTLNFIIAVTFSFSYWTSSASSSFDLSTVFFFGTNLKKFMTFSKSDFFLVHNFSGVNLAVQHSHKGSEKYRLW